MMMMEEAPEVAVGEEVGVEEAPQRTWFEFFATMLPVVSAPQTRQLERLPNVGVENVEMYRVHGVALSTGNIWQLLILRSLFPQTEFNSPHYSNIDSYIERANHWRNEPAWSFLRESYFDEDTDEMYGERFRAFLQALRGEQAGYNDVDDRDHLPTKIAKAIANIYYTNLELTVADIQQVIKHHYGQLWNGGEFSLDDINEEFVLRITHASIDGNRMELRTLLPYEEIVQAAVNELKHPPLTLQSVLEWMAAVWNKFVELLTDGWEYVFSPSNP